MKKITKILSIDGGGIRGIIPCMILEELDRRLGRPLHQVFDLIVGTSTGGIIALGLTTPKKNGYSAFSPEDLLDLYEKEGKNIFNRRKRNTKIDWDIKIVKSANELLQLGDKAYESARLEAILEDRFKNRELKDSLTNVLITSYDINEGKPFYFNSRLADDEKENFLIRDIARATSAAPTYFEPAELLISKFDDKELTLLDGGVLANNPSTLAYIEAKELHKQEEFSKGHSASHNEATTKHITPDDDDYSFFMLSIGTGHFKSQYSIADVKDASKRQWIPPLLKEIFMRSVSENTHHVMQHLLPPYDTGKRHDELGPKDCRYWRIDIDLDIEKVDPEMDNVSENNIKALKEAAEKYLIQKENDIDDIVSILKTQYV